MSLKKNFRIKFEKRRIKKLMGKMKARGWRKEIIGKKIISI
jgi:hypothetical protein